MNALVLELERLMLKLTTFDARKTFALPCSVAHRSDPCEATRKPTGLGVAARRRTGGFTLIELMIVVAIIGILAAIAIPSYQEYIIKSRRIEATSTLTQIQLAEEKYRGNNLSYGTLLQLGLAPASSYYTFSVTSSGDTYTLAATAIGNQASDPVCANLSIVQSSTGITLTPASCWK